MAERSINPAAEKVDHPFGNELPSPETMARAASVSYTPSEDIKPLSDPDAHLNNIVRLLTSNSWREQFDALDVVRSLALHHSDLLQPIIKQVAPALSTATASLRSSVCKNGILAIHDVCDGLGQELESQLGILSKPIVKRAADTSNIFISASANEALVKMIERCPSPRLVQTFLSQAKTKNASIRCKVAQSLSFSIDCHGPNLIDGNDVERVVKVCTQFLADGKPGTRQAGRRLAWSLNENSVLSDREIRSLSGSDQAAIKKVLSRKEAPEKIVVGVASPTRSSYVGSPCRRRTPGSPRSSRRKSRPTASSPSTPNERQDSQSGLQFSPRTNSPRSESSGLHHKSVSRESSPRRGSPHRQQRRGYSPRTHSERGSDKRRSSRTPSAGNASSSNGTPSTSPLQSPRTQSSRVNSGSARRSQRRQRRQPTTSEGVMEDERIKQRSDSHSERRRQERAISELREAEDEAVRLRQQEDHRQRTDEMAMRGRKRAEERIRLEKERMLLEESQRRREALAEEKDRHKRAAAHEKASEARRKETKQRISAYRQQQKMNQMKKEREEQEKAERIENERRENRLRARKQNQGDRPWRAGEKAMANSVQNTNRPNKGRSNRSAIDSKPLTQREMQQEIWRQRQKLRKKEQEQLERKQKRRLEREAQKANSSRMEIKNSAALSPRGVYETPRIKGDQTKARARDKKRNGAIILENRAIEESNWDDEIKRAQGMRAAGRGNHHKTIQTSRQKVSLSQEPDIGMRHHARESKQNSSVGLVKGSGNNALERELFGYHPAIPQRGATALTSELASLGMDTGGGLIGQPSFQQKHGWQLRQEQGQGKQQRSKQQQQRQQQKWNSQNIIQDLSRDRKGSKRPQKLMEIHEISSFEYGAHGELVPIENTGGTNTGAMPMGPQSPLSRHIQMEEMRQQQQNMRGLDGHWKNGWGESDPWVSPAPIRQRVLEANEVWPRTDAAEQQIMQDLASLDYALEANRRMQLRSTRSEPNGRPGQQRNLFLSKQRREPIATAAAGARRYPRDREPHKSSHKVSANMSPRNNRKPHRPQKSGMYTNNERTPRRRLQQQQKRQHRRQQNDASQGQNSTNSNTNTWQQNRKQVSQTHQPQIWQRPQQQQQQWLPQYGVPQQQPYYGYGPSYGAGPANAVSQPFGGPYFQQPSTVKVWM